MARNVFLARHVNPDTASVRWQLCWRLS